MGSDSGPYGDFVESTDRPCGRPPYVVTSTGLVHGVRSIIDFAIQTENGQPNGQLNEEWNWDEHHV